MLLGVLAATEYTNLVRPDRDGAPGEPAHAAVRPDGTGRTSHSGGTFRRTRNAGDHAEGAAMDGRGQGAAGHRDDDRRSQRSGPTRGYGGRSREELEAARDRTLPDVMAEGLGVVFCGMNPGLTTALVGHHFASPGNRFWPALARAGFTPETLTPDREQELLPLGLGLTNLVERATRDVSELSRAELVAGGERLRAEIERYRPTWLAFLGITGYRAVSGVRGARVGPREERLGDTRVWLLPNPSGRNAHWKPAELADEYARLREAAGLPDRSR